jgi:hypothetical protein
MAKRVVETEVPITDYKDLRLRKVRSDFRVGRAEVWLAAILDLPAGAVKLMLPGGTRRARSNKTIGSLRSDWQER